MLHLLNLACIKHTGQPLPSSALGYNRWSYENEEGYDLADNGEVIPKIKKLAIHRGLPDLTPNCIPDDPDFRIARSLVVGEINRIRNLFKDLDNLKIIWGSMAGLITVMDFYQRKICDSVAHPDHHIIQYQPLKVVAYCANITAEYPLKPFKHRHNIANEGLISKIAKTLMYYWEQGGYPFHYDYTRFHRKIRAVMDDRNSSFTKILVAKFYLPQQIHSDINRIYGGGNHYVVDGKNLGDSGKVEEALTEIGNVIITCKTRDHHNSNAQSHLSRFYLNCKVEDIYIDNFVSGRPKPSNQKDTKFHSKFWEREKNCLYQIESKIIRQKVMKIDCDRDNHNNSKIFTSSDKVKKTKYALEKFYDLISITRGSSMNLADVLIYGNYQQNPSTFTQFIDSGKESWRQEILRKDKMKLSGDEILRILAPNKKEEKKIVMDKFVESFNQ